MTYTLDISSRTAFELIMAIDKRVSDNLYKMGREEFKVVLIGDGVKDVVETHYNMKDAVESLKGYYRYFKLGGPKPVICHITETHEDGTFDYDEIEMEDINNER